jgi:inosine-uridine nucleoside N-ribohydrolase
VRVHLDTDFAGDSDDAAALAMLLGWAGAELVGITTTADPDGTRAAYVQHVLAIAGREVPGFRCRAVAHGNIDGWPPGSPAVLG